MMVLRVRSRVRVLVRIIRAVLTFVSSVVLFRSIANLLVMVYVAVVLTNGVAVNIVTACVVLSCWVVVT